MNKKHQLKIIETLQLLKMLYSVQNILKTYVYTFYYK